MVLSLLITQINRNFILLVTVNGDKSLLGYYIKCAGRKLSNTFILNFLMGLVQEEYSKKQ